MATKTVTGWRFLSKDPAIDLYRAAKAKSGKSLEEIARDSGITQATLRKWDFGDTKKPQHLTLRFAMAACNYSEEIFRNPVTGDTLIASYGRPNKAPKKHKKAPKPIAIPPLNPPT